MALRQLSRNRLVPGSDEAMFTSQGGEHMDQSKPADFFLTGLVVVWPVLLWAGHYEAGMLAFWMLLFSVWVCGLIDHPGEDDGRAGS